MTQLQLFRGSKGTGVAIFALVVASQLCSRTSNADSPDWKYYGTSTSEKDNPIEVYYDAKGLKRRRDGHVEVWMKGLAVAQVNRSLDRGKDNEAMIKIAATMLLDGYVPPYSRLKQLNQDQYLTVVTGEVAANQAAIQPEIRALYEIDCSAEMMRLLSIELFVDGSPRPTGEISHDWSHVPPETTGHNLLELVCPSRK